MENYVICMDTSGDIDPKVLDEYEVEFVPMEYLVGEEKHLATGPEKEEVMKAFYAAQRTGVETRTSQITPYVYQETFRKYLDQGRDVMYFCLSSGLSSTCESARLTVEELKEDYPDRKIYVVDTLSATGGIGFMLTRAVENRKNGMSIEENYESIMALIPRMCHFFMVEDLMYLLRGGRVSASSAYVGSMLNIKPILKIDEKGELATIAKKRGHKGAVAHLAELFEEHYDPSMGNVVYMCDGDARELQDKLKEKLLEKHPDLEFHQTYLCPVIGAHTGPGMISEIFIGKE